MSEFKVANCTMKLSVSSCSKQTDKLNTYDWLADLPDNTKSTDLVEVQFKPPRKGYFINSNGLSLEKGDIVAVEASPGHDIGTVTMTGRLVHLQIKKANLRPDVELKRIYRKARPVDMDKFAEAKAREHETMIESRQIANELGLKMKIGDVEYQGDGNKAIFYYIADDRVDFRQLIKVLADRFHVRIEMKQIGARQEAGRIGGIGPCGRELCCATWMTRFVSVSTSAARFQDLSLNPQKLAGQCAKLKCCMNYEVDQYVESLKRLPSHELTLQTMDNEYFFFKADILTKRITYSTDKHLLVGEQTISARRAFEIINMNREGKKPMSLAEDGAVATEPRSVDLLAQENINRFDNAKKKKKNKKHNNGGNGNNPNNTKNPNNALATDNKSEGGNVNANNANNANNNGVNGNNKREGGNNNNHHRNNGNRNNNGANVNNKREGGNNNHHHRNNGNRNNNNKNKDNNSNNG